MLCIYNGYAVFDWDENNLRKIRAHRLKRDDVEFALSNGPVLIYEQSVGGELRFVYYGETDTGRLLAIVLTERDGRIRVVTAYKLDAGQKKDYLARRLRGEYTMKKTIQPPIFANDEEEATWWASREGRAFLKQKSAVPQKKMAKGSRLVAQLNGPASVQIALRLPSPDVEKARELATRRGIGYQTLLKMLVHEGLRREEKRA
jgi:uncharacterized DUF497 family protein/predicted DNA binding CopG/RHH family protein